MSFINNALDTAKQKANEVITTVDNGRKSVINTASDMADDFNEKAVRTATIQMCNMLEIAIDELKTRPLSAYPVFLNASMSAGPASLQMRVQVQPK